jgi:hypothetical protein
MFLSRFSIDTFGDLLRVSNAPVYYIVYIGNPATLSSILYPRKKGSLLSLHPDARVPCEGS